MKINSLLYVLPAVVLLTSCYDAGTDASTGNTSDAASPILAKTVVGVTDLKSNIVYEEPCAIVDEEYMRKTFQIGEEAKLEEMSTAKGCEFEWSGNKVMLSFGGSRPYESMYIAAYRFDKMYQGKPTGEDDVAKADTITGATVTAGADPDSADSNAEAQKRLQTAKPAVAHAQYEPVMNLGDKAVWDSEEGILHVLYVNHIINVQVETKDKGDVKKERAQLIAEVLLERIAEKEYFKHL